MADTRYKLNSAVEKLVISVSLKGIVIFALLFLVSCYSDGSRVEVTDHQSAIVYIPKGVIQCEDGSGLTLQSSEQRLVEVGINVISSKCAFNNLIDVMDACGAGTAEIIIHEIPQASLVEARKAGYESTKNIFDEYTVVDCLTKKVRL